MTLVGGRLATVSAAALASAKAIEAFMLAVGDVEAIALTLGSLTFPRLGEFSSLDGECPHPSIAAWARRVMVTVTWRFACFLSEKKQKMQ